jgi:hypothetical protein
MLLPDFSPRNLVFWGFFLCGNTAGDNEFWGESDEIGSVSGRAGSIGWERNLLFMACGGSWLVGSAGSSPAAMRCAGLGIWVLDRGIDMFGALKDGILAI